MVIFKLLVLSYMHTTLYSSFFYLNNITKFNIMWKYKKKFESANIKILIFSDFSSMGIGLENVS